MELLFVSRFFTAVKLQHTILYTRLAFCVRDCNCTPLFIPHFHALGKLSTRLRARTHTQTLSRFFLT